MSPDEITRLLDELERRFGPAGEAAFAMALQWKLTDCLIGLAFGISLMTVPWAIAYICYRRAGYDRESLLGFASVIAGLVTLFGLMFVAVNVRDLLNVEYAALRDLIGGANR